MPFDGSGNYSPPSPPDFPAISGETIFAARYNTVINDISSALSLSLTRDNQGKPSAHMDWNAKNLTNVATLSAVTLAISGTTTLSGAVTISGSLVTAASVAGTAGLKIPHGTAPTTPADGDVWTTTAGFFSRINGATRQHSTLDGTETFTNKTFDAFGTGNVFKFNGNSFACAAGANTITMFNATDTIVGRATTDTLTNKTIALGSNTVSGTTAQFNTALTDGNFATLAGSETLTNKTLTTPLFDGAQVSSVAGSAPLSFVRTWVNFNGTGVIAIRSHSNVSSLTDNGTGDYTLNFTTAMPDANYAAVGSAGVSGTEVMTLGPLSSADLTTTSLRVKCKTQGFSAADAEIASVIIAR